MGLPASSVGSKEWAAASQGMRITACLPAPAVYHGASVPSPLSPCAAVSGTFDLLQWELATAEASGVRPPTSAKKLRPYEPKIDVAVGVLAENQISNDRE